MKYYKLTFLKDYPGYKKGYVLEGISEDVYNDCRSSWVRDGINISEIVALARDYPDFVSTELDLSFAIDTLCPDCFNSLSFPSVDVKQETRGYEKYVKMSFYLTCTVCGKRHYITNREHQVF